MAEEFRFMRCANQQRERQIRDERKAPLDGFGSGHLSSLQWILLHRWADYVCGGIVCTSLVVVGAEVNYMLRDDHSQSVPFVVLSMLLSVLLIGELTLRVVAFGPKWLFQEDRLGCLIDFICFCGAIFEIIATGSFAIVGECVTDCWLMVLTHLGRLLRVFRITRILKFVHPLRILVLQIFSALKSVFWALVFLFGVIYIFSLVLAIFIVASQLEKSKSEQQEFSEVIGSERWRSLPSIMNTLYKSVTGGVDWETPIESLEAIHPWLFFIFVAYVSFGVFAVLNVLTGVFCQKAIQSASQDLDHLMHEHFRSKKNELHVVRRFFEVRDFFALLDSDMSGTLDVKELARSELDAKVSGYLAFIGLEIDNWQDFLAVLDTDGDGQVDIDEFVAGIMRLRGPAKSLDVARLLNETRHARSQTELLIERIEHGLRMITQKMDECCGGFKQCSFHAGGSLNEEHLPLGPLAPLRFGGEMADSAPLGRSVEANEKSSLGEAKEKDMFFTETKRFCAVRQVENKDAEDLLAEPTTYGSAFQDQDGHADGGIGILHAGAEVTVDDVNLLGARPAQNPRRVVITGSSDSENDRLAPKALASPTAVQGLSAAAVGNSEASKAGAVLFVRPSAAAVGNDQASKAVEQLVAVDHRAGVNLSPAVPGTHSAPLPGDIQRGDRLTPERGALAARGPSPLGGKRGDDLAPDQAVNNASGQTYKALSSNRKGAPKVNKPRQSGKDKSS